MHSHAPPPTYANRRALDLPDLDAIVPEARRLMEARYEKAGQWDLSQICQHLAGAIHGSIDGGVPSASLPVRVIARFFIKDALFKSRKIRAGVPAPQAIEHFPSCDENAAIDRLAKAIDRLKQHHGPLATHPYFGKLSGDEWCQFHAIHASHHLGFLVPKA